MPDNNPIQQAFFAQQAGISPQQYQQLMAAQQQEGLANALLQQGETPVSTDNRSIGGVGYRVSPLEGLAKMAQILSGKTQQNSANEAMANALMPQGGGGASPQSADPIVQAMPPQTAALFQRLSLPESMGGTPRAAIELYNTYAAGMKGYNTGVGTAAAGNAPVGTMPPGVGNQQPPMAPPPAVGGGMPSPPPQPVQGPTPLAGAPVDPLTAYRTANNMPTPPIDTQRAGIGLPVGSAIPMGSPPQVPASALQPAPNAPIQPRPPIPPPPAGGTAPIPPPVAAMPSPLPGESNNQFQARLDAAKAGASTKATAASTAQTGEQVNAQAILAQTAGVQQNFDKLEQIIRSYPTSSIAPIEAMIGNIPGVNSAPAVAKAQMDQMVNATLLPQIKTMLQGTGQVRVPEINFLKELHNIDFGNKPEVNMGILNNLRTMVDNESSAALAKAGYNPAQGMPAAPAMKAYPQSSQNGVTHIFVPGKGIVPVGGQ